MSGNPNTQTHTGANGPPARLTAAEPTRKWQPLRGDSMSTTALYFAQVSVNTSFANPPAGMPALIGPTESPAAAAAAVRDGTSTSSFGIRDMCIYALSYYSTVINISASTSGVAVRRVRIRANAFNGRNGDTRRVPWQDTIGANGPPVILLQAHRARGHNGFTGNWTWPWKLLSL